MSRIIIDVGNLKSFRVYSNNICDTKRHDNCITINSSSFQLRMVGCISSWYITNRLKVIDGDYVKLVRRYPAWLFCLLVILLTLILIYFRQPIFKMVMSFILAISLDKYIAYTLRKVVITLAMT